MGKILITGGAGCIGSDLALRLASTGAPVRVLDNLSSGRRSHLAPLRAMPNVEVVEGDLLDPGLVGEAMQGVEFVHHLAANPDVKFQPGDPTDKDLKQNLLVTYNVLEAMRQQGVGKIAFSSTSAIYGVSPVQPIPEDLAPMRPISLYGASKLACENLLSAFHHLFGIDCWIFRFANIVGPKVRKRGRTVLGDFLLRLKADPARLLILGNGQQHKSYLRNEECVDAMLYLIERQPSGFLVANLGADDWISVNRIAELLVESLGLTDVQFEYTGGEGGWLGDVPRFRLDVSRLNGLGWKAQLTSEQAIRKTIAELIADPGLFDPERD